MKIALLISGHCRTFVYEEQRIFFEKLINHLTKFGQCDVYIMIKTDHLMQTEEGIIQLEKIIKMLNPVYSIAFKQWNQDNDNCYYSQMRMIRHLIDKADVNYDYYIRIRPDCVIPNLDQIHLNNKLCTSRKFDSRGNDQFFIMSQKILIEWFLKLPIISMNVSPEYYIFNCPLEQNIDSGLVRDYKKIQSWNSRHSHLNIRDYWLPQQTFVSISYDLFINKLKNIIQYEEVI
jgi:hypothetical protein